MTEYRAGPKIPKPDPSGECSEDCPLYISDHWSKRCQMNYHQITDILYMRPGPGCPWYVGEPKGGEK